MAQLRWINQKMVNKENDDKLESLKKQLVMQPAPQKKASPQLSQRDSMERAMNSAYKGAIEKGTLGRGFGGPAQALINKKK